MYLHHLRLAPSFARGGSQALASLKEGLDHPQHFILLESDRFARLAFLRFAIYVTYRSMPGTNK
eukprot:4128876-Amphidinium_carterae.1